MGTVQSADDSFESSVLVDGMGTSNSSSSYISVPFFPRPLGVARQKSLHADRWESACRIGTSSSEEPTDDFLTSRFLLRSCTISIIIDHRRFGFLYSHLQRTNVSSIIIIIIIMFVTSVGFPRGIVLVFVLGVAIIMALNCLWLCHRS